MSNVISIGLDFDSKIRIENSKNEYIILDPKNYGETPGNLEVKDLNDYLDQIQTYYALLKYDSTFTITKLSSSKFMHIGIDSQKKKEFYHHYSLDLVNVDKIILKMNNHQFKYEIIGNNQTVTLNKDYYKYKSISKSDSTQTIEIANNYAKYNNIRDSIKIESNNTNSVFKLNSNYFKVNNYHSKKLKPKYLGGKKYNPNLSIEYTQNLKFNKSVKEFKVLSYSKNRLNFLTFNKIYTYEKKKQVVGYRIMRKSNRDNKFKNLADLSYEENYYFDSDIQDGNIYIYKIKPLFSTLKRNIYTNAFERVMPEKVWDRRKVFKKSSFEISSFYSKNQRTAKKSNAKKIKIIKKPKPLYNNSKFSITAKVIGTKGKKLTSKKIKYISSNTKYLKINQKGKGRIIKKPKSGKIKVYLRAHNGLQKYITIKVK